MLGTMTDGVGAMTEADDRFKMVTGPAPLPFLLPPDGEPGVGFRCCVGMDWWRA